MYILKLFHHLRYILYRYAFINGNYICCTSLDNLAKKNFN